MPGLFGSGKAMSSPARSAERLFGQEISRFLKNRGISQEELGFQAGIHRTYVSQIERGLKSPTLRLFSG
jgi:DNA-binding XRE family transcriptional regulator